MAYITQTWNNNDSATPINATRLNHIESGIQTVHTKVDAIDTRVRPFPNLMRINYGYTSPNGLTEAQEGALVGVRLMQFGDESHIAGLKAGNPDLKVFRYFTATEIDPTDGAGVNDGVGYTLANNGSNPTFFLYHGASRITSHGGAIYMADPGDSAYQAAVVNNILTQLAAAPAAWDGVFFDEYTITTSFYGFSQTSDKYPTDAAWLVALRSFLKVVVPQLHAAGLKVILNIGDNGVIPGAWESLVTLVDGSLQESWTDGGSGLANQDTAWPLKFAHNVWGERNKKLTLLHSHNTTQAGNRYGLAASLLSASYDGYTFYDIANGGYSTETTYSDYTTAAALGPPMGDFYITEYRVYKRDFAYGTIVVNTKNATSASVSFGRPCTGSGLTSSSSTTVAAYTAYILLYD